MLDLQFAEHARQLDDALRSVTQSIVDATQDLIHDLAALDACQRETDDAERRFWLFAAEQKWLDGPNETARKLAKENAYEREANQSPFHLHDRKRRSAEMQVEIDSIQLRLRGYRDELAALQTRAGLLPFLAQAAQGMLQANPLFQPMAVAS